MRVSGITVLIVMPVIQIKMWEGRTKEQKKELIKSVTDAAVRSVSCSAEAVQVLVEEYPKENWGIAGELSSEKFPE